VDCFLKTISRDIPSGYYEKIKRRGERVENQNTHKSLWFLKWLPFAEES
jgi:hypothetical protein